MHRRQIIVVLIVVAGVSIGVVLSQWRTCSTSQLAAGLPATHSLDNSVQVVLYTTTCRRWWAREDDQDTVSYVLLPVGEPPPAKPNQADIVYQVNWLKAGGRSEATSAPTSDMGAEEAVRGGILLTCEKSWCPKQEAILKQVDQWHGHRIFYERK